MKQTLIHVSVATALLATAFSAVSAPVTFFGEDISGDNTPAIPHPNADAAKASFFAHLTGVGTETFESIAAGTTNPTISFGAAGSATLSGGGDVYSTAVYGPSSTNQFPISGTNFFITANTFSLTFSSPISAFGFYATDLGDGASASLLLTDSLGGTTTLPVETFVDFNTGDGSALYYGFYDTEKTYTSIAFVGGGVNGDTFGFDDFSIGSNANIVVPIPPSGVPEPETIALFGIGLVGVGALRRRMR